MIKIGNRIFYPETEQYVMGILNITPDSFSDGGSYNTLTKAMDRVDEMIEEGAAIIDVGGESTRPGYTPVPVKEEIKRVVPIIRAIKNRHDIPVSLDTSKSEVALAGIEAGVDLINDVYGFEGDKDMAKVCADAKVPVCIVHNREKKDNSNFITDVILDLRDSVRYAAEHGIDLDNIIIDPGIGFAKTYEQNLQVLSRLDELKVFKKPILLGVSRKSFIGITLDETVNHRLAGTLVSGGWGLTHGASFLRVHDVKEHVELIKMVKAITDARENGPVRTEHTAYIAFGSNVGNRQAYIDKALKLVNSDPGIRITARSKTIETAPYGGVIQSNFLNGVIEVKTTYSPRELLAKLQIIELECDRVRTMHWGPRTLDLDILLYDDITVDSEMVTIPHPDMQNREFVLGPLCEIAPDVVHPGFNKTAKKMLDELRGRI